MTTWNRGPRRLPRQAKDNSTEGSPSAGQNETEASAVSPGLVAAKKTNILAATTFDFGSMQNKEATAEAQKAANDNVAPQAGQNKAEASAVLSRLVVAKNTNTLAATTVDFGSMQNVFLSTYAEPGVQPETQKRQGGNHMPRQTSLHSHGSIPQISGWQSKHDLQCDRAKGKGQRRPHCLV